MDNINPARKSPELEPGKEPPIPTEPSGKELTKITPEQMKKTVGNAPAAKTSKTFAGATERSLTEAKEKLQKGAALGAITQNLKTKFSSDQGPLELLDKLPPKEVGRIFLQAMSGLDESAHTTQVMGMVAAATRTLQEEVMEKLLEDPRFLSVLSQHITDMASDDKAMQAFAVSLTQQGQ